MDHFCHIFSHGIYCCSKKPLQVNQIFFCLWSIAQSVLSNNLREPGWRACSFFVFSHILCYIIRARLICGEIWRLTTSDFKLLKYLFYINLKTSEHFWNQSSHFKWDWLSWYIKNIPEVSYVWACATSGSNSGFWQLINKSLVWAEQCGCFLDQEEKKWVEAICQEMNHRGTFHPSTAEKCESSCEWFCRKCVQNCRFTETTNVLQNVVSHRITSNTGK